MVNYINFQVKTFSRNLSNLRICNNLQKMNTQNIINFDNTGTELISKDRSKNYIIKADFMNFTDLNICIFYAFNKKGVSSRF